MPALCESRFHLINFRFLHISSRSAAAKSEFARFPIRSRQRHKTATTADDDGRDAGLDFFTIPLLDVTALCGLLFLALMVSSFLPREESHVTFDPNSCKCNIAFMSIFLHATFVVIVTRGQLACDTLIYGKLMLSNLLRFSISIFFICE